MMEARRRGDRVTLIKDKLFINNQLYEPKPDDENMEKDEGANGPAPRCDCA